jgi:hypothetical protein
MASRRRAAGAVLVVVMCVLVAGVACRSGSSDASATGACAELGPAMKAGAKASGADDTAMLDRALAQAPKEIEADLRYLADMAKKVKSDPTSLDKAESPKITETATRLLEWTASNCADKGPYWACLTQSKLASVGTVVDPDAPPATAATPEAAVGDLGTAKRVEISRTDSLVEFGTLNDAGRVTKVREVRKQGTGWIQGADRQCK